MEFVDTPAERFEGLKDYPFAPHFRLVDPGGLRMHTVDEGPPQAAPILMLHGEPSWSYLYRCMIPPCVAAGHRVLAPDLIGFGRSSKPTRSQDYSYQRHCDWVRSFIEGLDLRDITLFCQDWGSLIGLRLAAELGGRFARIVVGNGFLPAGRPPRGGGLRGVVNAAAFLAWRSFARWSPRFPAARIVQFGTSRHLDADELRAYDAPFPDDRFKAGARAFPLLVPISPRDPAVEANRRAWEVLERWEKPFLTVFSNGDPITRGLERILQERIPGAQGQPHCRVRGGHFLQEDAGPELAGRILDWIQATPASPSQARGPDAKLRDMEAGSISVETDGGSVPVATLGPEDRGGAPALVVVPSIFGGAPDLLERLSELADRALVAVPDPFWRVGGGVIPYADREAAFARLKGFEPGRCLTDLRAVVAWAQRWGNGRVVGLGICFGGPYVLRLASDGLLDGVVTWHGSRMEQHLERAGSVSCPLRLHFGDADPVTPPAAIEAVRAAFAGHPDVSIVVHPGAEHGFSHDGAAYDPVACRAGLDAAAELLDRCRGGRKS